MAELYAAVLGPLHVELGGVPVRLGPRLVALLSALLIEAGRSVPAGRLAELVWEGSVPPAPTTLRSHISHLRRALGRRGPDGDGVLTTVGSGSGIGYRLDIRPPQVDAHRFEAAHDEARRLLDSQRSDDAERAVALLRDALALWRGPAYADVAGRPFAMPEIARLTSLRRYARRSYAEALTMLGHRAESIGQLTQLVLEEPHDEGARRLLALALYADQRVDEAAQVCRDGVVSLRDRGIDAPALEALQRNILRRTVSPGGRPAAVLPPAPSLLPPDPTWFVGRVEQTKRVRSLLCEVPDRPVTVLLTGPAGVGKTAFAIRLGHLLAEHFPDGQLYLDLRGFDPGGPAMTPNEALRILLDALGVPTPQLPSTVPALAGKYRALLAARRVLLVLDNARDAEQVRPLLPGAPGCRVLVTSRNHPTSLVTASDANAIGIGVLSADESRELLARRLGTDRLAAAPAATDRIVDLCAGLPLALSIVAARAAYLGFDLATVADELRRTHGGLDGFASGDVAADLRSVFSWSYRALDDAAARLFRLLGLHLGPDITVPAAASLAGMPVRAVRPPLTALASAHLVDEHRPGRYAMHDLLRGYATELAGTDPEAARRAALDRLLDHYLRTAESASVLLYPSESPGPDRPGRPPPGAAAEPLADRSQATAWFSAERAALLALCRWTDRAGPHRQTWQLAQAIGEYLDDSGHWQEWAETQRAALAAARELADPAAQAEAHHALARAYTRSCRYDDAEAHYRHALAIFAAHGDATREAHAHRGLGGLCQRRGQQAAAAAHNRRALELYRGLGDSAGQAMALNNVGWLYATAGDYRRALPYCREALDLLRQAGRRHPEAASWDSLGYIHHRLGQRDRARACYQRALDIYRELGDRYNEADTLSSLADVQRTGGDPAAARRTWTQALEILERLGHADADAVRAKLRDAYQAVRPADTGG